MTVKKKKIFQSPCSWTLSVRRWTRGCGAIVLLVFLWFAVVLGFCAVAVVGFRSVALVVVFGLCGAVSRLVDRFGQHRQVILKNRTVARYTPYIYAGTACLNNLVSHEEIMALFFLHFVQNFKGGGRRDGHGNTIFVALINFLNRFLDRPSGPCRAMFRY